jgi:hypothetical protein
MVIKYGNNYFGELETKDGNLYVHLFGPGTLRKDSIVQESNVLVATVVEIPYPSGLKTDFVFIPYTNGKNDLEGMEIKSINFFVEKVKYKTAYKIKFYAAHETGNFITKQDLAIDELLFESPILTLEEGTKIKVDINLEDYNITITNKDIFVCLELQGYYDDNNTSFQPETKDATRLKFQLSKLTNYYSRMYDLNTKQPTDNIINRNTMINRDFAFMFFKKPHKSELVAPAIIINATKTNEHLKENK